MAAKTPVYLVGTSEAPLTNQWEHMTNSLELAQKALLSIPEGVLKVIQVEPKGQPEGAK